MVTPLSICFFMALSFITRCAPASSRRELMPMASEASFVKNDPIFMFAFFRIFITSVR